MTTIIYHGSKDKIERPKFGLGKKYNDYGLGFYCTKDLDLAKEWAVDEFRDGFANEYEIDDSKLSVLDLTKENFSSLHWIELLLSNRTFELKTPLEKEAARYLHDNFHVDISSADIIIGYRADDSYFSYAQDFISGAISSGQLSDALTLGKLGKQYVVKSKKAFEMIKFRDVHLAISEEFYPIKKARDLKARRDYYKMDTRSYIKNDLYMIQIIDQEIKADDSRIR